MRARRKFAKKTPFLPQVELSSFAKSILGSGYPVDKRYLYRYVHSVPELESDAAAAKDKRYHTHQLSVPTVETTETETAA